MPNERKATIIFNQETFIQDLFNYEFKNVSIRQKIKKIAQRGVYTVEKNCTLTDEQLDGLEHYRAFLKDWNFTQAIRVHDEFGTYNDGVKYKVYCLARLSPDRIHQYYNTPPNTLEGIISLCLACGIDDFHYINEACNAFCHETPEGKGLRKILLNAAAHRWIDFDEIAYCRDTGKFGLLEKYYDESLSADSDEQSEDETVIEKAANKRYRPRQTDTGTLRVVENLKKCANRADFEEMLKDKDIQNGFLYDKIEMITILQDCVDKRRKTMRVPGEREGDRAVLKRYGVTSIVSSYFRACRGHKPDNDFYLSFALGLCLTEEESEHMQHAMHVNPETSGILDECFNMIKEINALRQQGSDCSASLRQLRYFTSANRKSLPNFYDFLQKYSDSTLNQ